ANLTAISLNQEEIDRVERVDQHVVEDIWPLSPLQEGLFFHASYDQSTVDVYTAQDSLDFDRALDVEGLRVAGSALLQDAPGLRAGFTSDGLSQPVQFIAAGVEIPIREVDV